MKSSYGQVMYCRMVIDFQSNTRACHQDLKDFSTPLKAIMDETYNDDYRTESVPLLHLTSRQEGFAHGFLAICMKFSLQGELDNVLF